MSAVTIMTESDNEPRLQSRQQLLLSSAKRAEVTSQETMERGADLVKQLKTLAKAVDEERQAIVKPFNDGVSAINLRFKTIITPLNDAAKVVSDKMLAYQQAQRREAEEKARLRLIELEKERNEKRRQDIEAQVNGQTAITIPSPSQVAAIVMPPHITRGGMGASASVRKTWTFELKDIAALVAARPDLVEVNTVAINKEIAGKGGEIPGLHIFQKESLSVR